MDKVLLLIKSDAVLCRQEISIKTFLLNKKFSLKKEKRFRLNKLQAKILCKRYKDEIFFEDLIHLLINGTSISYIVEGDNVIEKLRKVVGDFDPLKADHDSLRRIFISSLYLFNDNNPAYNSVIFSESLEEAKRDINIIYKEEGE